MQQKFEKKVWVFLSVLQEKVFFYYFLLKSSRYSKNSSDGNKKKKTLSQQHKNTFDTSNKQKCNF